MQLGDSVILRSSIPNSPYSFFIYLIHIVCEHVFFFRRDTDGAESVLQAVEAVFLSHSP